MFSNFFTLYLTSNAYPWKGLTYHFGDADAWVVVIVKERTRNGVVTCQAKLYNINIDTGMSPVVCMFVFVCFFQIRAIQWHPYS